MLNQYYKKRSDSYRDKYFSNEFPWNYQMMFKELAHGAKIPVTDLQKALTVNTLREFKDKLKSFYTGANDNIPFGNISDGIVVIGKNTRWTDIVIIPPPEKRSTKIEQIMAKYL